MAAFLIKVQFRFAFFYAQGGISAVLDSQQTSIESHIRDTINSGAGLCDPDIVKLTVEYGKQSIEYLFAMCV
jgi:L-aspartate oxidase